MSKKETTILALSQRKGLSVSSIEKFRMGILKPSAETAERIETALNARIFSSPSVYCARQVRKKTDAIIKTIVASEGVDEAAARKLAQSRYPKLFASKTPKIKTHYEAVTSR